MTISLAPLVVAVHLAAAAPVPPQTPATSGWEQVDALPPGTRIQITRTSGERHLYIFRRATGDAIVASREAGAVGDEAIPKTDVTKLVQRDVRDGAADGTAAGALIGFGAAIGLMAIAYTCDSCDPPAFWVLAGPAGGVGAGAGALTGFLIDRRRLGSKVLYPAPERRGAETTSAEVLKGTNTATYVSERARQVGKEAGKGRALKPEACPSPAVSPTRFAGLDKNTSPYLRDGVLSAPGHEYGDVRGRSGHGG